MSIEKDLDAILKLLPRPKDISEKDARRRLKLSLNARQMRTLRADLESLTPQGLRQAGIVGPAGLSKFDEAVSQVKTRAAAFAAEFENFNDAVVSWLAQHPDGKKFLEMRNV